MRGRGRGMGRSPIFRGPPLVRGPVVRRSTGFLGWLGWLFPGLIGFGLGKSYGESERAMAERETELQQREADLHRREVASQQQKQP